MIKTRCQFCGKVFDSYPSQNRKFCSTECSSKGQKIKWSSRWTEEEEDFIRENYKIMSNRELAEHLKRTENAIALHIHYEMPEIQRNLKTQAYTCEQCGKIFMSPPSLRGGTRVFCSSKCHYAFNSDEIIEINCACCNKNLKLPRHRVEKVKNIFCSVLCKNQHYRGERHFAWRGGRDYYPYGSRTAWFELREVVLKRDGYICQECSSSENLQIHHKIPYRLSKNNNLENLTTLCMPCHSGVHHEV